MPSSLSPRLLDGLSIYQDVVWAGQTAIAGTRDCQARWRLIEPHLPRTGSILDVGSNFGWFALQICQSRPECVVASAEADYRSARVQREVLASHVGVNPAAQRGVAERICLITRRLNGQSMRVWIDHRQRFDAALCLNVLHWITDHRQFLHALGAVSARIFVEHPDPNESGAGIERVRREIGPIGSYLAAVFPHRPVICLGAIPSHRHPVDGGLRTLWMVEPPRHATNEPSPGLDLAALMRLAPVWPNRDWWLDHLELARAAHDGAPTMGQGSAARFTARGVEFRCPPTADLLQSLRGQAATLPDTMKPSWRERVRKVLRSLPLLHTSLG
jgi:hypothetical protein